MRFFGTIKIPQFDEAAYTKTLRKSLEIQFRKAAAAFVRAAYPRIPVQTGMARGSFLNIARFLRVALPIQPTRTGQRYYTGKKKWIPKTKESGALLTTSPERIIRWQGTKLRFEINSKVFHLGLEDIIGVHSGPWASFAAGHAAFVAEMKNLKKRLPKIAKFIVWTTINLANNQKINVTPIKTTQQETF